jgi:hypothetical protein
VFVPSGRALFILIISKYKEKKAINISTRKNYQPIKRKNQAIQQSQKEMLSNKIYLYKPKQALDTLI